jgi:4-amino-4-deoxy-L-arabinose transferase-like glycosyltransferase
MPASFGIGFPDPLSRDATALNQLSPENPDASDRSARSGGAAARPVPRRVTVPPEPHDPLRLWSSLLIAVVVCLPPLLIGIGQADVMPGSEEASSLLRSRETWRQQSQGRSDAWLVPSANGERAIDPPPMTVWLHMAGWLDLDPATAETETLVRRARLVSAGMGLLALLATYWAALSLGGVRVARLTTMALGTTLLFLYQARIATAEAVLLGWGTLAIAAGLWAMRPLRPINWFGRRVFGWPLAGLAMGAAMLTKGPIALGFILPPLIAAIPMTPKRRGDNTIGLLFAVLLGGAAALPWYLYVLDQVPDAWSRLVRANTPPAELFALGGANGLLVLAMLSPWPIWLLGGLFQPFVRATAAARRQLLVGWFWFVVLFAALVIPAAGEPRYLLPALPAAALMVGQLWSYHARLASERREEPGVNLLRVPHWLLILGASVAVPLLLGAEGWLTEPGSLDELGLPAMGWPLAVGLSVVLLGIALFGTRYHFKWRPRIAAYATVGWMVVGATVGLDAYARSPHSVNPHRRTAVRVVGGAADRQLVYLYRGPEDRALDPAFLFYLGRAVRPVTPDQLEDLLEQEEETRVIVRRHPENAALMRRHRFLALADFRDGSGVPRRLYRGAPEREEPGDKDPEEPKS